jgi:hypothetical protein
MNRREAAELLERLAVGDEGPQRERTVQRLLRHRWDEPYPDAETIATDSLVMVARQVKNVYDAAELLGIQL